MTLDEQIQIWGAIGTWLAGAGTLAAVIVALYLSRKADRIRIKVIAGLRLLVGDGSPNEKMVSIGVTNLGDRPVTINSIGWAIGKGKEKRVCIQPVSGVYTARYPITLAYGNNANFMQPINQTTNWIIEFANGFIKSSDDRYLKALVVQVHTSVGITIEAKPELELIESLKQAYSSIPSAPRL